MIKIAIVEDEAAVRDQLTDYVRRYTRQYGTEFEVTCFTDGDSQGHQQYRQQVL